MDEHDDEEKFSLSPDGAKALYDFALGRESIFDNLDLGCVLVAAAIAAHGRVDFLDLDIDDDKAAMPLGEMPETAEKLRSKLRTLIGKETL